ncbi:hypothetical protein AXF42_Ash008242 [Apostasia shenzhenica]|uniref:Uncharacterized protein n=1 Tax=Apostasia shenzhenica TaxID=1088818 RepID=A0A2I0A8X3_9ASPA|nr:hypothetical protein AXF42_Ash008242 [Apostasia shenzhenica]
MTVLTVPSENKGQIYRGEVGLALGSGLVAKDLEEKMDATSTPDLYSGMANRVATVLARLPLALNRALRTEEQVLEQGSRLHQKDEEIEALRIELAVEGEKAKLLEEKNKLQEKKAKL